MIPLVATDEGSTAVDAACELSIEGAIVKVHATRGVSSRWLQAGYGKSEGTIYQELMITPQITQRNGRTGYCRDSDKV